MSLSLGARVYIWLVVAAAAAMLAYWQRVWQRPIVPDTHTLGLMFTLVGLAILTMHFPLAVTPRYKVTLSLAIYFACLLLFGPPAAMVLVGGAQLLGGATLIARRNPATGQRMRTVRSALFNTGQYMLATGFAGLVYYAFLPHLAPAPLERVENLWALPLAGTVMYLANTVAVAVIVGLQRKLNPLAAWCEGRRVDALQLASLLPLGVITALAAIHYPWAPLVIALPASIIHLSLKRSVELVEKTNAALEAQRQLAQQVEELAKHEAEAAALRELDRLKDELMATISHELATPLTVVHGYAGLLQQRAEAMTPKSVKGVAEQILTNSTQLARLVDDLADFRRLQRGEVAVEPQDFDLVPAVQGWLPGLRQRPGGERVRATLPGSLPVHADRARLLQVVTNLVENAIKYAPEGPIDLRAGDRAGHDGAPPMVWVQVEDCGPGIATDEQARVWEKFVRGRNVAGFNIARGSGIGLAVVKTLVEAQGGRVGLDSAPGLGSRFWFELPAAHEELIASEEQVATSTTSTTPVASAARTAA